MLFRLIKVATKWVVPSSAALLLLSLTVPAAHGQIFKKGGCSSCPTPVPYPCATPEIRPAPAPMPAPAPQPAPQPPPAPEPTITPEQFAATGEGESFAAAAPNVIGDFGIASRGTNAAALRSYAFKIAENESPRPGNRFYISYNYFNNVGGTGAGVHREMPGFERAVLDGNASFGARLPIYQTTSEPQGFDLRGWGNLNLIGKYAFINNPGGNVFSGGMVLTLPTGRDLNATGGTTSATAQKFNDTIFTPYLGGFVGSPSSNFYVQGFSSIAIPTATNHDIMWFFNDISAGFWAYRGNGGGLSGVIPTVELHVNNALNHRQNAGVTGSDQVITTLGSHFLFNRSILTLGAATPINGNPRLFDIEAIAQFNYRY